MSLVGRSLRNPLLESRNLLRRKRLLRGGRRHKDVGVIRLDAFHQDAVASISGNNGSANGIGFEIQSKFRLSIR